MDGAHVHGAAAGGGILAAAAVALAGFGAVELAQAIAMLTWIIASVMFASGCSAVALAIRANGKPVSLPPPPWESLAVATVERQEPRQLPAAVHHHWHGTSAADVAAILINHRRDDN